LQRSVKLPSSQFNCLKFILNANARAVTRTPKFSQISTAVKSLHYDLKLINASNLRFSRFRTKFSKLINRSAFVNVSLYQPVSSARCSSDVVLLRTPFAYQFHLNDRSFSCQKLTPSLWISLLQKFRQPSAGLTSGSVLPLLALFSAQFHSKLKTVHLNPVLSSLSCCIICGGISLVFVSAVE
jgi:hypothetical protein